MEAEIVLEGRSRTQVNRKVAHARKDLAAATPCTIFSPEDLALVSGGPKLRRELLDDALGLVDAEGARAADEVERILRQRAALLRQAGGRVSADVASTLDVWDQRLADAGKILVTARERLVGALGRVRRAGLWPSRRGSRSDVLVEPAVRPELDGRAARRVGGAPQRRSPAGGEHGGAAPRRPPSDPGGPGGQDPCLPGRTALPGPGAAHRGAPAGGRRTRTSPRSCSSTTSSPSSTRPGAGPWWPNSPQGSRSSPRRRRCPPGIDVAQIVDIAQIVRAS